jgi:energy-coupling factor transporter ATP-binding protein EcfA2
VQWPKGVVVLDLVKAVFELLKDAEKGKKALELLYGGPIPPGLIFMIRGLVWTLLVLGIGAIILKLIAEIQKSWGEAFGRWFTGADEKHFLVNRQRFARFISAQLEKLNIDESWEDYRFAELEAEVEAEGLRRSSSWMRRLGVKHGTLRRERSLSVALEASEERLVLLEGEPGSGKSVALRHVANRLAEKGGRSWNAKTVIPLYLNLKHLQRRPGAKVDQDLIRNFTLEHLTRVNNRDVERFIEEHFDDGIRNGTWVFLFDSFDEIPDVLSSTDDDNVIAEYSNAIYEFLTTFNACKGIVASRYFRSPRQVRLPRFRILPLSEERRTQLIRRAGLRPQVQQEVFRQLGAASLSIRQMANNPMFLGLLCEFVRDGRAFPDASHAVFERYVERRLWRDEDKLADRFAVTPEEARSAAEIVAFAMAADDQIGLNPTRREILSAIERLAMNPPEHYHDLLTALEYIKLARGEEQGVAAGDRRFTFAHRRFQEYFCTCVVLRSSDRVTPTQLLTEPRWRDTTVVLMQTQGPQIVRPLLEEAKTRLLQMRDTLSSDLLVSPEMMVAFRRPTSEELGQRAGALRDLHPEEQIVVRDYPWPKGCLHVLGILQDGLTGRPDDIPSDLRELAASLTPELCTRLAFRAPVSLAWCRP